MTDSAVIGECMTDTANCEIFTIHEVGRGQGQLSDKINSEGLSSVFQ